MTIVVVDGVVPVAVVNSSKGMTIVLVVGGDGVVDCWW